MDTAKEDENLKITVSVKIRERKENIEIKQNAKVMDLKQLIGEKINTEVSQLCLIFAGKILKDEDTLEACHIKDGLVVHLVIKASEELPQFRTEPLPRSEDNIRSILSNFFMSTDSHNPSEMHNTHIMDLLNGQGIETVLQHLTSQPEILHGLLMNAPQIQELITQNPELGHLLNNADLFRQTLDLMRNPAVFQELTRSNDRALNNLESFPGGYNALQRMYRDVQEPMYNLIDNISVNQSATSINNSNDSGNPQQGTENRDPLPNPWSNISSSSTMSNMLSTLNLQSVTSNRNELNSPSLPGVDMDRIQLLHALFTDFARIPRSDTSNLTPELAQDNTAALRVRYQTQLEQLSAMGFENSEENLAALILHNGNIDAAVQWLLE